MSVAPVIELSTQLAARGCSIPLGSVGGFDQYARLRDSVAVVGPTGSGKTSSVFIPAVASHPGPVVVTAIRDERHYGGVRQTTAEARSLLARAYGRGKVLSLALDDSTDDGQSVWWDFTEGCRDWSVALRRAATLAAAGLRRTMRDADVWRTLTADLLAPLLFVASRCGRTDVDVANVIFAGPCGPSAKNSEGELCLDVADWFRKCGQMAVDGVPGAEVACLLLKRYVTDAPDTAIRDTFLLTGSKVLNGYKYPILTRDRLSVDEFVQGWGTLYVTCRKDRAEAMSAVIAALVDAIEQAWSRLPKTQEARPLLLALDEVAIIAPMEGLPDAVMRYGGDGIQLLLGFQRSSSAIDVWGDVGGRAILHGVNQLLLLWGLDDHELVASVAALDPDVHASVSVQVVPAARTPPYASASRLLREAQAILSRCGYVLSHDGAFLDNQHRAEVDLQAARLRTSATETVGEQLLHQRRVDGVETARQNRNVPASAADVVDEVLASTRFVQGGQSARLTPADIYNLPEGSAYLRGIHSRSGGARGEVVRVSLTRFDKDPRYACLASRA